MGMGRLEQVEFEVKVQACPYDPIWMAGTGSYINASTAHDLDIRAVLPVLRNIYCVPMPRRTTSQPIDILLGGQTGAQACVAAGIPDDAPGGGAHARGQQKRQRCALLCKEGEKNASCKFGDYA